MFKKINKSKGFSLFELLLVVGIMALMTMGTFRILDIWFKSSVDRSVAKEIIQLQSAAEGFVDLNFNELKNTIVPIVGSVAEININDLVDNGFIQTPEVAINSYKQPMRVFIRHVTDSAAYGSVIEVVTISEGMRVADKRIINVAANGGPKVGFISNLNLSATCCNGTIQNSLGSWTLALNEFSSPNTTYNSLPNGDGGYVAAYGRITNDQVLTDQYLFRVPDVDYPNANRMDTNIDMNNNNITNVDVTVVESMNVANNAVFSGIDSTGLSSPYVISVRDNFDSNNLTVRSGGNLSKGNVNIDGDNNNTPDFIVNNDMTVNVDNVAGTGNISTGSISTQNLRVENNAVFQDLNLVGNDLTTEGNIYASRLAFGRSAQINGNMQITLSDGMGTVNTDKMVARSITVNGGGASTQFDVTDIIIENNLAVDGNVNADGRIISRNDTTITNMTNCGTGCP